MAKEPGTGAVHEAFDPQRTSRLHTTLTHMEERGGYLIRIYPVELGEGILTLPEKKFVIGREKECELMVEDQDVSRRHASIEFTPRGYIITDLNSTNGTFINDDKVNRAVLKTGDLIRLGKTIFKFLRGDGVEKQYHETVYSIMITDGLTGVSNKRFLMEALDRELSRSQRHKRPLSLAILDLDHFKSINDKYGHLGGDMELREIARRIKAAIRRDEVFARYGGEEFVIVLPESTLEQARQFSERVRELVGSEGVRADGITIPVTVSIGIGHTDGGESISREEMLGRADKKLYEAKNSGRNRVMW
ncbi:MAG TPA: GGDEF domain-containing protein [Planctomycetota bacterium]|nr:GGDEF domain-containing protein [Planctomycetota bacterium]